VGVHDGRLSAHKTGRGARKRRLNVSSGPCSSFEGFYCHTSGDTCANAQTDCPVNENSCVYSPAVGHFACGTVTCNG
jgi:hypothetical protein